MLRTGHGHLEFGDRFMATNPQISLRYSKRAKGRLYVLFLLALVGHRRCPECSPWTISTRPSILGWPAP